MNPADVDIGMVIVVNLISRMTSFLTRLVSSSHRLSLFCFFLDFVDDGSMDFFLDYYYNPLDLLILLPLSIKRKSDIFTLRIFRSVPNLVCVLVL